MKKIIIIIAFLISTMWAFAQQEAMYTHYMYNTISINPAYAGSRDALSMTLLNRSQWVGIEGAPKTMSFNAHSPIGALNTSLGLSLINDNIGVTNSLSTYIDYSFKVKVSDEANLYLGLKAGFDKIDDSLNDLISENPSDVAFDQNYESSLMPNFGFGLYYKTNRYYVGASVPRLLKYKYGESIASSDFKSGQQHFYLIGGAIFDLNETWQLKSSTFVKGTKGAPIEADITAKAIFNKKIWVGVNYRTNDAVGFLAGIYINPQLAVGYAYDYSYDNMKSFASSHEILITYDLIFNNNSKIISPRFF